MHKYDKFEPKKPYLITEYENGVSILDNDDNQFIMLKGAKEQKGHGKHKVSGDNDEWKMVTKDEEGNLLDEVTLDAESEEEAFEEIQEKMSKEGDLTPVSPTALKYWD